LPIFVENESWSSGHSVERAPTGLVASGHKDEPSREAKAADAGQL
jgi:hypothetical protein